jgi:toxin ParE1/3/4
MKRYRFDPDAATDLKAIHKYIARDNLTAADRLVAELKQKFRLLSSQPLMGQLRDDLAVNLRSFCAGNYVIFYRPTPNGIEVARVIHAARDVGSQF